MKTQVFFYGGLYGILLGDHGVWGEKHGDSGLVNIAVALEDIEFSQEAFDKLSAIPPGEDGKGQYAAYTEGDSVRFGWVANARNQAIPEEEVTPIAKWDMSLFASAVNPDMGPIDPKFIEFADKYKLGGRAAVEPGNPLAQLAEAIGAALDVPMAVLPPGGDTTTDGGPSPEQLAKIAEIEADGYVADGDMSVSAAGLVMKKGEDIWFFGMNGEIMHNPEGISVKFD